MIGEDRQKEYVPLSNGLLAWLGRAADPVTLVVYVALIAWMGSDLWHEYQTGTLNLSDWLTHNWLWPFLFLQALFDTNRKLVWSLILSAYVSLVLWSEISGGALNATTFWRIGDFYWLQGLSLIFYMLVVPFIALKKSKPE